MNQPKNVGRTELVSFQGEVYYCFKTAPVSSRCASKGQKVCKLTAIQGFDSVSNAIIKVQLALRQYMLPFGASKNKARSHCDDEARPV